MTINNTGSGTPLDDLAFTDALPAGVVIATPSGLSTTCIADFAIGSGNPHIRARVEPEPVAHLSHHRVEIGAEVPDRGGGAELESHEVFAAGVRDGSGAENQTENFLIECGIRPRG